MSFGVIGFGGGQLYPRPQVFQALSLGGASPTSPTPPYGSPNTNLVPVQRTGNPSVPANLSLTAAPVFQAILRLNSAIVGFTNQPVGGAPNTTNAIGATNPAVSHALVGQGGGTSPAAAPSGPISFALTTTPANISSVPSITSAPSLPPSSTPQYVEPVSGSQVQRIVQTIRQIAVAGVYPAPVFSFSA